MKIGIDARLYRSSTAGIGRYSQNLIKNLLEIDSDNQYVLLMTAEDKKDFEQSGIQANNVEIIETTIEHYSLAEQINLAKLITAQNCDLWHFLNFNVPLNFHGKYIVTIHDLTLFYYEGRNKKNLIHKLAYKYIFGQACRKAQKIVAVSNATKNDLMMVFKIDSAKIEVVYEAADDKQLIEVGESAVAQLNQKFGLGDLPVILYVGQWRPHKNLIGLIEAFNLLRKDLPAKLAIVGKIDLAFPEVLKVIDKSPYLSDIIKSGFVSDKTLASFYRRANVFVFPSFYEGFGLPGLEAMASGVPVVSSDRTSLPEIYGSAALYFNPSDPEDMSQKIKQVLTDQTLSQRLINEGFSQIKKFSWRKTAEEMLKLYKQ